MSAYVDDAADQSGSGHEDDEDHGDSEHASDAGFVKGSDEEDSESQHSDSEDAGVQRSTQSSPARNEACSDSDAGTGPGRKRLKPSGSKAVSSASSGDESDRKQACSDSEAGAGPGRKRLKPSGSKADKSENSDDERDDKRGKDEHTKRAKQQHKKRHKHDKHDRGSEKASGKRAADAGDADDSMEEAGDIDFGHQHEDLHALPDPQPRGQKRSFDEAFESSPSGGDDDMQDQFDDNMFKFAEPTHKLQEIPTDACHILKTLGLSETSTVNGITMLSTHEEVKMWDASQQMVNRFCVVAAIDEKGGMPSVMKKFLYNVHHTRKFFDTLQMGAKNKNAPFEVRSASPNDATVLYRGGHAFYSVITPDGDSMTLPVFKLNMFIDQASTADVGGLSQAYMFLVLEVPLCFDFVEFANNACKHAVDISSRYACETMKSNWVDVSNHLLRMSGKTANVTALNIASVRFENLFDELSEFCMWKLLRIAPCIRAARLDLHVKASQYRVKTFNETWGQAARRTYVMFKNIDKWSRGRHDVYRYDNFFTSLSDRSSSCQYAHFEQYKAIVEKHNRRRKQAQSRRGRGGEDGGDDAEQAEAEADDPPPQWDSPPRVWDCQPTFVDYEDEDVRRFIRQIINEDDGVADVEAWQDFVLPAGTGKFEMCGMNSTMMCANVELNLFKHNTSKYMPWDEWRALNPCMLPSPMTLEILFERETSRVARMDHECVQKTGIFGTQDKINLPGDCNTLEDFRQMLLGGGRGSKHDRPLKGRCSDIYVMQSNAVRKIEDGRARVEAMYSTYPKGTVFMLVDANVKTDTGEMGGRENRIMILSQIAQHLPDGKTSPYRARIVEKFDEGMQLLRQNFSPAQTHLGAFTGGAHWAQTLLFLLHEAKNLNGNLKPANQQINYLLHDSDIGFYLNFLGSYFEMAKNGIGLTLWCQNFAGCAQTREKTRGCGVDESTNQFNHDQHPANSDPPEDVDLKLYPSQAELKDSTEKGMWKEYVTSIGEDGSVLEAVTEGPSNKHMTEVVIDQKGETPLVRQVAAFILRNSKTKELGSRLTVQPDPVTGRQKKQKEIITAQLRLLIMAFNNSDWSHYFNTLEVVCYLVAAGAVDDEKSRNRASAAEVGALRDMGRHAKYNGSKQVEWVRKVTHMLSRDITSLAAFCAYTHSCNFFGSNGELTLKSGVETCWQQTIIALVFCHRAFMSDRAACPQNWSRVVDMATTRLIPHGMQIHAANTLAHPLARKKTWHELAHVCLLNFMSNPCPAQTIPVFLANLLSTSLDWMLFLCFGIFVDFFNVPAMDPDVMEQMFSDPNYQVPERHAAPVRAWLQRVGLSGDPRRSKFEPMVSPNSRSKMERSTFYLTTKYEEGMEIEGDALSVNVEPARQSSFGDETKAASPNERACAAIARVVGKINDAKLSGACNIVERDKGNGKAYRPVGDCLHKNSVNQLPYHKFGQTPSGRGWRSSMGVLKALGVTALPDVPGFFDTSAGEIPEERATGYQTTPFLVKKESGTVYRFGVCFKTLLAAAAVIGKRQRVSQCVPQAFCDHFTRQFIAHRVPKIMYPAAHIFTALPCAETGGFSYSKLPDVARPTTMIRPEPYEVCLNRNEKTSCGILDELRMPEDFCTIDNRWRIWNSVRYDDGKADDYDNVVLKELCPPQLPTEQFFYVEVEFDFKHDDASQRTRQGGVLYLENGEKAILYVDESLDPARDAVARLDKNGSVPLSQIRHDTLGASQRTLKELAVGETWRVMISRSNYFIHYKTAYARRGVLLEVDMDGHSGVTVYCVLQEWHEEIVDGSLKYFNPGSMGYLGITEAVQPRDNLAAWPDTAGEQAGLYTRSQLIFNVPHRIASQQMVAVGTRVFMDARCGETKAMEGALDCTVGYVPTTKTKGCSTRRGASVHDFFAQGAPFDTFFPVLEVVVLYELPAQALCNDDRPGAVYVGIQTHSKKSTHGVRPNVRYAAVNARSLVTASRLQFLKTKPAVFALYEN